MSGLAPSRRSFALPAVLVAVAGLAGIAVAFAPLWLEVTLLVLVILGLLIAVLRILVGPPRRARPVAESGAAGVEAAETTRGWSIRDLTRLLYYAGMLTLGGLVFRVAMGFTVSDWLFLLALMLALGACIGAGTLYRPHVLGEIGVGWLLFACGGVLSSAGAVSPNESLGVVGRLAGTTVILFWLSAYVLRTERHVRTAILAWGVSTALAGLAALLQLAVDPYLIPDAQVAWGRVSGTTPGPNSLGGLAAIALVPLLALALDGGRRRERLIAAVTAALTALGLVLSGSVGGFVAAVAALVCWLALRGVSTKLVLASVAVVVVAVVVGTTVIGSVDTQSPGERLQSVTDRDAVESGRGGSIFMRLEGYEAAIDRIRSQPFVGVGMDEPSNLAVTGDTPAHNMFLNTWLSGGVFALAGLVLMLLGAFRIGVRAVREASDRSLAAALLAAYVGFLVDGLGEPILFVRYGWLPAALLAALRAQQVYAARRVAAAVPTRRALRVAPSPAPTPSTGRRL